MRVLLAGASGALGGPLLRQLVAAGHTVCGTSRSNAGAHRVASDGGAPLVVDVMDRDALLAAVRGHRFDAVIHELTALKKAPLRHRDMRATNALRIRGTAHLLEVAQEAGARRFVTQSIVFGYGYRDHGSVPLTEETVFGAPTEDAFDEHLEAMVSTEQQTLTATGIDGIALRYGLLYGADLASVESMLRKRQLPVVRGGGEIPFVHHDDAAAATVAALERGGAGRVYNIVDDAPATFRDYVVAVAEARGTPHPLVVPGWLLSVAAPYGKALFSGISMRVSNARAASELAWRPRFPSIRDGIAASVVAR